MPLSPISPRTHERVRSCALCGVTSRLTDTHVPPRVAFNDQRSHRAVVDDHHVLSNDRGRDGGHRVWGHCENCRTATSAWDDEYITWAKTLAAILVNSPARGLRDTVTGSFTQPARPGRFARAALAGMTALAEDLVITHPGLATGLRSGAGVVPLEGLRFLMALTQQAERTVVTGQHQGIAATVSLRDGTTAESSPTPSAVIHFPPLSLLLVDDAVTGQYPHVDCSDWLSEPADHARPLKLDLPAVQLVSPVVSGPRSFRRMRV